MEAARTSLIACVTEQVLLVNSLLCGVINLPDPVALPAPVNSLRLSIIYFPSHTGTKVSRSNTQIPFTSCQPIVLLGVIMKFIYIVMFWYLQYQFK